MKLHFYNFLNYSSRKLKSYATLNEYSQYYITTLDRVAFNPNNNVSTSQIVNYDLDDIGNYVIYTDEDNNIISRWYIMQATRLRTGQYRLDLKRDVLADNIDNVLNSNAFIEKGSIKNINDPLIYNNENISFNQIKQKELELKDTKTSEFKWIVGYYAKKTGDNTLTHLSGEFSTGATADYVVDDLLGTTNNPSFYKKVLCGEFLLRNDGNYSSVSYNNIGLYNYPNTLLVKKNYNFSGTNLSITTPSDAVTKVFTSGNYVGDNNVITNKAVLKSYLVDSCDFLLNSMDNKITDIITNMFNKSVDEDFVDTYLEDYDKFIYNINSITSALLKYSDAIFYNKKDGKYYKYIPPTLSTTVSEKRVILNTTTFNNYAYELDPTDKIFINLHQFLSSLLSTGNASSIERVYSGVECVVYSIGKYAGGSFQEVSLSSTTYSYDINNAINNTIEMNYGMFCIPYYDGRFNIYTGTEVYQGNNNIALKFVSELTSKYSGANVLYDVQLLPYTPIRDYIKIEYNTNINGYVVDLRELPSNLLGQLQIKNGSKVLPILTIPNNQFTFDIVLEDEEKIEFDDILTKKISNETKFIRLCSPNYNGQFEFRPAKNNGLNKFNIDCTYKPYNPYIHINPDFGGLYGADYDDARGLICGGEFSLPIVTNAWSTYELQNKNYQNIFDRQIENMEVNNSLDNIQKNITRATGVVGATITGAAVGGVAGAIVGFGTGVAGGAMDAGFDLARQGEQLDYTKDLFGYQLGNIKALPNSVTRTTAITNNNKVFPILEYYGCTTNEEDILKNKLKWNGYSIMEINTFKNRSIGNGDYIKCRLIDFNSFDEPTNVLNEVNAELNKGVYYYDTRSAN